MAKKYYAVQQGRKPGIYMTWADCEAQVKGYSGAVYKSFGTEAEAFAFIGQSRRDIMEKPSENRAETNPPGLDSEHMNHLIAYIDGSYDKEKQSVGAGGIMFYKGDEIPFSFGTQNSTYTDYWNVSGELLAAMYVMAYARRAGALECSLYYDYMGIEMWALKKWKRNNPLTQAYAEFCERLFPFVKVSFHKVAAHTGDTYNEMADQLAKSGTERIDAVDLDFCSM